MRVGAYIRASTTEQAEGGHSLDAQRTAIASFCNAKGWQVVEFYTDPGYSGSTGDRPALQQLLADAEAGQFDLVICHALDRFYRSLRGLLGALDRLNRADVTFVSIVENVDFTSGWGKMALAVQGTLAEIYLDALKREVRKGKRQRARKGLSNASLASYGYLRIDDRDVIDEEQARAVVVAFEAYATGEYSDQAVADLLNREGYPPSGWKADRWLGPTLRKMLKSRVYIGEVIHRGEWFAGQHEPIISQELWDQAQKVRQRRGKGSGGPRTGRIYLLQRVGFCWRCRLPLYVNACKRIAYYLDSARVRGVECPDVGRNVPMDIIDEQVAELVSRLRLPEDWRSRLEEIADHREERQDVEGKRRYLRGKLRRLRELYLDGDFERREYDQRKAALTAQLDALQVPDAPDVEQAGETLEELGEIWANAPLKIQRDMLRMIFQAIYIDIGARRLVCVKPYPQFAPLFRLDSMEEKEDGCFYYGEDQET